MTFYSSGEEAQLQWKQLQTQQNRKNSPRPVTSSKDFRSRVQGNQNNTIFTHLTKNAANSQCLLQKDLKKTLQLQHFLQTLEQKTSPSKHKRKRSKHRRRKKSKHHSRQKTTSSSSSSERESTTESESESS
nr:unnamed protein product [TTV-like mini virus]